MPIRLILGTGRLFLSLPGDAGDVGDVKNRQKIITDSSEIKSICFGLLNWKVTMNDTSSDILQQASECLCRALNQGDLDKIREETSSCYNDVIAFAAGSLRH